MKKSEIRLNIACYIYFEVVVLIFPLHVLSGKGKGYIIMFKLQACSDVFVPALKLLEGFHEDNLKVPVLHISLCLHQMDATIKQLT